MRYKKLKILDEFDNFIPQYELDKQLQEYYGYSLLNFAFVVADVLDGITLFNKILDGRKISDIKKEIKGLEKIKQKVLVYLESHIKKHYQFDIPNDLSNEVIKILLIKHLNLEPFFSTIDNLSEGLNSMLSEFKPLFKRDPQKPEFLPYSQSISCAYQISFLWAFVMCNKYVHWLDIQNLLGWFLYHLDGSAYEKKIEFPREKDGRKIGGNIEVMKNQYIDFKNTYGFPSLFYCLTYFPRRTLRPFFSKVGVKDFEDPKEHSPVISIIFYEDKIRTIFDEDGKLKARETIFEKKQCRSIIRDYRQEEEKSEKDKLLLEVP